MKIKKTYRRSRAGLLAGLLGFSTLSSCVNTGRQLVMNNHQGQYDSLKREEEHYRATLKKLGLDNKPVPWCKTPIGIFLGGVLCIGTVALSAYMAYQLLEKYCGEEGPRDLPHGNGMEAVAIAPVVGLANTVNTTVASVGSAVVTAGKEVVTTAATVVAGGLPTAGIIAALMPNRLNATNNSSSGVTTPIPVASTSTTKSLEGLVTQVGDAYPVVQDAMVLDEGMQSYVKKNGLPIQMLKSWRDQGLNMEEARDKKGRSLLMIAAGKSNLPALKFLIEDAGVNVNQQNDKGNTALHYIVFNSHINPGAAVVIVEFLVKSGADPCIKNKNGSTVKSYNTSPEIRELLEGAKKCS